MTSLWLVVGAVLNGLVSGHWEGIAYFVAGVILHDLMSTIEPPKTR